MVKLAARPVATAVASGWVVKTGTLGATTIRTGALMTVPARLETVTVKV